MKSQHTYHGQSGAFLAAIATSMPEVPADIMQRWINEPGSLKNALFRALCGPQFPTWKTVHLGARSAVASDLFRVFKQKDIKISEGAESLILSDKFAESYGEKLRVGLARVAVCDLNLPHGGTISEIYHNAKTFGLRLCPPECAPVLRIDYDNQPEAESLCVATETFPGPPSKVIFVVERGMRSGASDGSKWLREGIADTNAVFKPIDQFVFATSMEAWQL